VVVLPDPQREALVDCPNVGHLDRIHPAYLACSENGAQTRLETLFPRIEEAHVFSDGGVTVTSTCQSLSQRYSELFVARNAHVSLACAPGVIGGLLRFLAKAPEGRDCRLGRRR
jgi:hypothetical protein